MRMLRNACACADASVGAIALALKRFGATFKNHPNLAKYAQQIAVCFLLRSL